MKKYIVCGYHIILDTILTKAFDTKKEALQFISINKLTDKLYNESNLWVYKLIEVNCNV